MRWLLLSWATVAPSWSAPDAPAEPPTTQAPEAQPSQAPPGGDPHGAAPALPDPQGGAPAHPAAPEAQPSGPIHTGGAGPDPTHHTGAGPSSQDHGSTGASSHGDRTSGHGAPDHAGTDHAGADHAGAGPGHGDSTSGHDTPTHDADHAGAEPGHGLPGTGPGHSPGAPEPGQGTGPSHGTEQPAPQPAVQPRVPLNDTGYPIFPWRTVPISQGEGFDLGEYLPTIRRRGPGAALGFALLAMLSAGVAGAALTVRRGLRSTGALPSIATALATLGRGLSGLLGLAAVVALIPQGLVPALPWIAVAGAVALGWSLRDALPDLVAWASLSTEGRVRRGMWIRGDGFEGRVDAVTLRTTWIVDARGDRTSVPNHLLVNQPLQTTIEPWPEASVHVHLPQLDSRIARAVLREAALLTPWLAPAGAPEIGQDPNDQSRWSVRVRLLEGQFRDRFEGTFPERVADVLRSHRSADPS